MLGWRGKFLCYNLQRLGQEIDPNLPGDDRPELDAALYAEAENWLMKKRYWPGWLGKRAGRSRRCWSILRF
ncbi:MAG: hypothetical protein ACJ8DI_29995 [Ktedonobacteraceae bacterium]